jgi:hypothetical protein
MITEEGIKIFINYLGDIDNWARRGSKKDKLTIKDKDWYLIDNLIQDVILVKKGLTSMEFESNLKNRLKENCDGEDSINQLKRFAEREKY